MGWLFLFDFIMLFHLNVTKLIKNGEYVTFILQI